MKRHFSSVCRVLAAALLAAMTSACAAHEPDYWPTPPAQERLVQVEIYNRSQRTMLPVYSKDGQRYVVGTPGQEYAVHIRNRTGGRVLVVTSVDGVNVISGETASPSQSGYVLEPWGSVEIIGWRKNLDRTAAFFFTDHRNSYAARTGRPNDVGVIGVAAFREKAQPVARPYWGRGAAAPESSPFDESARAEAPAPSGGARGLDMEEQASRDAMGTMRQPQAKLGTGHGRQESSPVRMVDFQRATSTPTETIAIRYDRRENLAALGVLPWSAPVVRHDPEPFPGMRFAPDPPRYR